MSKKLAEKAGMIQLPPLQSAPTASGSATPETRPKTAPGSMLHFMGNQSAAIREVESLREQLQAFDGALPTRLLDPRLIRPSRWANRIEQNFSGSEFVELKAEIEAAGGNVQAIKVRPVIPREGDAGFEIVFGHRRHRACLELGLPVLATVEEVSDQALFVQMERENRDRKDLSAWEQGVMYARAIDQGLYPSHRQLASAIHRDLGDVGRAISLARLPRAVVDAFASPLDLQFRWAKPLNDMQQADPDGLLKRAHELQRRSPRPPAREVFAQLVQRSGTGVGPSNPPRRPIVSGLRQLGHWQVDSRGRVVIELAPDAVPEPERERFADHLARFFKA